MEQHVKLFVGGNDCNRNCIRRFTGNMTAVSDGALDSAKEAVTLCITMLGVMFSLDGLMEIANRSGLIDKCTKAILPLMQWLFPGVPKDHDAMQHITTNVIANF